MADDHNALLARADHWLDHFEMQELGDADLIGDLAAELRALTSRYHTALHIIHRYRDGWSDLFDEGTRWNRDLDIEPMTDLERAVLDQAKDPHP